MAEGIINGSTNNVFIASKIEWSSVPDLATNSSTVTAKLYYKRTNTGYTTAGEGTFSLTIDGECFETVKEITITEHDWVQACQAQKTVGHSEDGSRTVTITAQGSIATQSLKNTYCSGEVQLDHIVVIPGIVEVSDVVVGEDCTVKWTPRVNQKYKVICSIEAQNEEPSDWEQASDWIEPDTQELYCHNISVELRAAYWIPGQQGTMKITLMTYNTDGTELGSSGMDVTATVPLTDETRPNADFNIMPNPPFYDKFLQGVTNVTVCVQGGGQCRATIAERRAWLNGNPLPEPDEHGNFDLGIINEPGIYMVTAEVTDSRGFVGIAQQDFSVNAYSAPTVSGAVAYRCDTAGNPSDEGEKVRITAQWRFTPLEGNSCGVWYKINDAEEETALVATDDEPNKVDAVLVDLFENTNSYRITIGVTDTVGKTGSTTLTVAKSEVHNHKTSNGWGFGGMCGDAGGMDVHWDARFRGQVYIVQGDGSEVPLEEYIRSVMGG